MFPVFFDSPYPLFCFRDARLLFFLRRGVFQLTLLANGLHASNFLPQSPKFAQSFSLAGRQLKSQPEDFFMRFLQHETSIPHLTVPGSFLLS